MLAGLEMYWLCPLQNTQLCRLQKKEQGYTGYNNKLHMIVRLQFWSSESVQYPFMG